ncbi:IS630 family transposase, partial [Sinorhizobium meliloti]|nr:IS630 family transposase [Sinorhizobium meliloti]MDW9433792.1 IS630 family transposase [Sinorhizobium meliloti]MDW9658960.1 IS630 family transposase [Sinorhizobium meliloti]MDW9671212.1 IS630 family transposase [Sinorhizobium meliloti]MDW9702041.1 IS630 family transposase [Sinorhizobium meliloti]
VARHRARWLKHCPGIDPARLVFIDESVLQRHGRSST